MDVTLADLLILEPRLVSTARIHDDCVTSRPLDTIEVSWAVSARTTAPHVPNLRGGEMLLVHERVAQELGPELSLLLREARMRGVSAFVLTRAGQVDATFSMVSSDVPVLGWDGNLGSEAEFSINRLLTECRGNLYRIGSELERQMADIMVSKAGIGALARLASIASGLPIAVEDGKGRRIASFPPEYRHGPSSEPIHDEVELRKELTNGATLILGPLAPAQRIVARFLEPRIADSASAALRHDDDAKPRGMRRVEAAAALLASRQGSSSDQRATALAIGLDPDDVYFVAVSNCESESALTRALSPIGVVFLAGKSASRSAMLVAVNGNNVSSSLASQIADVKRRWERDHTNDNFNLALSAPARGVASLPAAAREAEFVALLQAQNELPRRAASFESVEDIGALRLLYHLRDTTELRHFVAEALGALENRDQRGALRETLRAFLESGGSQVEASSRLGIHRNTLAYRLRRIGELVGKDVGDPSSWLTLHLALRASQMLQAYSDDR